tara:strand:+ start:731 stop:955 length:225 start_codon:yes stop_codon:yes gene_type:complete
MKEIIVKLHANGDLFTLFKEGLICWTVLRDKDIYMTYMTHLHTGMKKTQSVKATADQFQVDDGIVWRAVKKMEA